MDKEKKRFGIMMVALALVLGMAQCRKPVETINAAPTGETVEVTLRVANGAGKTEITPTGVVTWKAGDRLYVVGATDGLLGCVSATAAGDPADFTGKITALTEAQTLKFYYVGAREFTLDGSGEYTFDISGQDGSLAGIAANNQLMWGKIDDVAVGTTDLGTISMTSVTAIAHFNIRDDGGNAVAGPVTVTGGCATSTFNAKTYAGETLTGTAGDMTMTFATGTTSTGCHMALLPGSQTLTFTTSDGKTKTLAAKTIVANTFYNAGSAIAVTLAHETVNFGTPDLNWSVCNLGATNGSTAESWYGDYYAWGATETWYSAGGQTSSPTWKEGYSDGYDWAHCPFTNGIYSYYNNKKVFTKYVPSDKPEYWAGSGDPDNKLVLESSDDAATAAWGEGWRMPTKEEWQSLYDNNAFECLAAGAASTNVTSFKAVAAGYLVVKGGKNSIALDTTVYMFLPAAGLRDGTSLVLGAYGGYYGSSLDSSEPAYVVGFSYYLWAFEVGSILRCVGVPVRPVRDAR